MLMTTSKLLDRKGRKKRNKKKRGKWREVERVEWREKGGGRREGGQTF
jgi:hypothetical protein